MSKKKLNIPLSEFINLKEKKHMKKIKEIASGLLILPFRYR